MVDSTLGAGMLPKATARRSKSPGRMQHRDVVLYLFLGGLIWLAWRFSRLGLFTAASNTGYWIGVAGGVSMLLLFTYPMRKHFRFMARLGSAKPWFVAHMVLGVGGPVLILLHSTFQIGSINAGVALFSMLIVAASGVVGRFLYVRLHRNLHGEKLSLVELRGAHSASDQPATRLRFAPLVAQTLADFEKAVGAASDQRPNLVRALFVLPWQRWVAERSCRHELKIKIIAAVKAEGGRRKDAARLLAEARQLVHDELMTLQRIAQFSAWERLFSWWHVAHVPFVYLMVLSAIAHVVAVHAY